MGVSGANDAFVLALNATNGQAVGGFGNGGVQIFGGTNNDQGNAIADFGTKIYVAGTTNSPDAGVGGAGRIDGSVFGGFLLGLDETTAGAAFPVITSPLTAVAVVGMPFNYALTSSPPFQSSTISGLPPGLSSVSSSSGQITGTPTFGGVTVQIVLSVTTSGGGFNDGTTTAALSLQIVGDATTKNPPVVQGTVSGVALDAAGNRYICGSFSGAVDFNPQKGLDAKISAGGLDAFVTCYDANGNYVWTQTFGGSGDDIATGVVVAGSTVFACGRFNSANAGFGGAGSVGTLGGEDGFVIALNIADGSVNTDFATEGVQRLGGSFDDGATGIAVGAGVLYVSGTFESNNMGVGALGSAHGKGDAAAFVCALSANSGVALATFGSSGVESFGGSNAENGAGVATDGTTVYLTGTLNSTDAQIGNAGASYGTINQSDMYLVALDAVTGLGKSGFGSGGITNFNNTTNVANGNALAVSNGIVYVAGNSIPVGSNSQALVVPFDGTTSSVGGAFGSGGFQTFGGLGDDYATAVAVSGSTIYVGGKVNSQNPLIGGGTGAQSSSLDAFVFAIYTTVNSGITTFGNNGVRIFGGSLDDEANALAVGGGSVFLAGDFLSTDASLDGIGSFDSTGFGGFLLQVDAATGGALPVITSALTGSGNTGDPFNYVITATNTPISFTATGL